MNHEGYIIPSQLKNIHLAETLMKTIMHVDPSREVIILIDQDNPTDNAMMPYPFNSGEVKDTTTMLHQTYHASPFDRTWVLDQRSIAVGSLDHMWEQLNMDFKIGFDTVDHKNIPTTNTSSSMFFTKSKNASDYFRVLGEYTNSRNTDVDFDASALIKNVNEIFEYIVVQPVISLVQLTDTKLDYWIYPDHNGYMAMKAGNYKQFGIVEYSQSLSEHNQKAIHDIIDNSIH
jgi:hypothetical protein